VQDLFGVRELIANFHVTLVDKRVYRKVLLETQPEKEVKHRRGSRRKEG
jgi:hypothetical protein